MKILDKINNEKVISNTLSGLALITIGATIGSLVVHIIKGINIFPDLVILFLISILFLAVKIIYILVRMMNIISSLSDILQVWINIFTSLKKDDDLR